LVFGHSFLHDLAGGRLFSAVKTMLAHLPTLILFIGYPVFWMELYLIEVQGGRTTWLAWFAFAVIAVFVLTRECRVLLRKDKLIQLNFWEGQSRQDNR
jgi:hypothetical protein